MTAHELARALLDCPDLPVATHASNHTYASHGDAGSHGPLKVGILVHYSGQHVVIGNISRRQMNPPNWWVSEMLVGDAPVDWDNHSKEGRSDG